MGGAQLAWGLGQANSRGSRAAQGQVKLAAATEESAWLPEQEQQGWEEVPTQMQEPGAWGEGEDEEEGRNLVRGRWSSKGAKSQSWLELSALRLNT